MAFPLSRDEHRAIEARIQALPELIVAAAVRTPFGNITRERPARHGDLWLLLPRGMNADHEDVTHGFMTSRGRFVDRQEAARIVVAMKQGTSRVFEGYEPALFSEDMWLDLFEIEPAGQEVTASADGALEASSTTGTGGPIPFPPPPKDPTHDQ